MITTIYLKGIQMKKLLISLMFLAGFYPLKAMQAPSLSQEYTELKKSIAELNAEFDYTTTEPHAIHLQQAQQLIWAKEAQKLATKATNAKNQKMAHELNTLALRLQKAAETKSPLSCKKALLFQD